MAPKITIVTPSFNQAEFLEETLRSVVSQRDQIHEYFVVDGGSSDGSVDVIRKYARWIDSWESQKDNGQSDAICRGFHRATGDFLFWINSDDVLLPGAVWAVRAALSSHPSWDVVTGYHVAVDAGSRITRANRIPGESRWMAFRGTQHVCQPTCFFRRELFERVGRLNQSLHCVMDTDLWLRMFQAGAKWGHVPRYLAAFRQHVESKGRSERWAKRYAEEAASLSLYYTRQGMPLGSRHLAKAADLTRRVLTGSWLASLYDTWNMKGRELRGVFGAFDLPAEPVLQSAAQRSL